MVSMCCSTGPGGRWSRSLAISMRISGDPIPTARLMPSRSSLTLRSNAPALRGQHRAAAGLQVQVETLGRVLDFLPVGRIVGARVERILQEDRVQLEAGGVFQELEVVPAQRAEGSRY